MKPIVFICRVEEVHGGTAYVTGVHMATGERFESQCEESQLQPYGIGNGMEFEVLVHRGRGRMRLELKPLQPKQLTKADMQAIHDSVDSLRYFPAVPQPKPNNR